MICAERIGVSLIRLRLPALRATGIVRSFAAADQLLVDWAQHLQAFECGFELVYLDGQVLRGALAYRR